MHHSRSPFAHLSERAPSPPRRRESRRGRSALIGWALGLAAACSPSSSVEDPVFTKPPAQDTRDAGHVLRRVAFGPTPALLDRLASEGTQEYVAQQLQPASIVESSALQALLAQGPAPTSEHDDVSLDDLIKSQLARAIFSDRQLLEQMTVFWDNHFSTDYWVLEDWFGNPQTAAWFEWRENELFRESALTRFEDLLIASATSPAMLVYLNSAENVAAAPNENYARELVELHTMGVDNGYTEQDVEELARCFTGWTLCRVAPGHMDDPSAPCGGAAGDVWAFHFDAANHDTGAKVLFEGTSYELIIPARSAADGLQDGIDVLRYLPRLRQTAEFVSRKLVAKFVSDEPPEQLVRECADTWQATDGNIRAVVTLILESDAFLAPENRWNKVETPLESLCSTVRALDCNADGLQRLTHMRIKLDDPSLWQPLFRWATPDGFPEDGRSQLNTASLLGRAQFNKSIFQGADYDVQYDFIDLVESRQVHLAHTEGIVDELLRLYHQENFSQADFELALAFATTDENGAARPLVPGEADYELRLRQLACFVASLPQSLEQ